MPRRLQGPEQFHAVLVDENFEQSISALAKDGWMPTDNDVRVYRQREVMVFTKSDIIQYAIEYRFVQYMHKTNPDMAFQQMNAHGAVGYRLVSSVAGPIGETFILMKLTRLDEPVNAGSPN